MTPEQLDEAIVEEAKRRINKNYEIGIGWLPGDVARVAARLAREGWTPPEPEPVDPDILAFREWLANDHEADGWTGGATLCRLGRHDGSEEARAYLAGARMAREQERERARPLVEFVEKLKNGFFLYATYRELAAQALAKYQGEA